MGNLQILRLHIRNTCTPAYIETFEDAIELLQLSLRVLDEDDFPVLRQQLRDILEGVNDACRI